jgi:hypothetical protein
VRSCSAKLFALHYAKAASAMLAVIFIARLADDTVSRLVFATAWVLLAVLGRTLQVRLLGQGSEP